MQAGRSCLLGSLRQAPRLPTRGPRPRRRIARLPFRRDLVPDGRGMHIEGFKVFCDLAETESFTQAAKANGVTQSAVSQQVSSLERQLRCLLIERSKKKFRLTREGQVLYEHAKPMVQAFAALQARLLEAKGVATGAIRVATIYSIGLHDLPPYVKRFLKAFPNIHVHVEYRRANEVYDDVLANAADIGLVACPVRDARLVIVPLRTESMVIITSPSHPLAGTRPLPVEKLEGQRFIAFEPDIPTRKAIDRFLRDRGVAVRTVMEFDNIETVKRAVEVEAGVSVVPEGSVVQEVERQSLVALPLAGASLERPLAVIHRADKVLTPAMSRFIAMLADQHDSPSA
jgi:DNA-binding transcriptional LysR family regulator